MRVVIVKVRRRQGGESIAFLVFLAEDAAASRLAAYLGLGALSVIAILGLVDPTYM